MRTLLSLLLTALLSVPVMAQDVAVPEDGKQAKVAARASVLRAAQVLDAGGPDAYGYQWWDSDDPAGPVYEWVDISGTGTVSSVSSVDDDYDTVTLPFAFPFYGQDKTTLYIGSNGLLTFHSDEADEYSGEEIPDDYAPNDFIAPFMVDLAPRDGGTVYYEHDAANERFIVQYDRVSDYGEDGNFTFEVLLYADGRIVFQYADVLDDDEAEYALVGIENADGTDGLQIAYEQPYLKDGLAIHIGTEPPSRPRITSAPATRVRVGEAYSHAVTATYPGGDDSALTLAAPTLPAWLTFTDHGGGSATLEGTPSAGELGAHDVVLQVTAGDGESSQLAFTIDVVEPLAGTYTIGSGQDYETFTAAAEAVVVNGVSAAVTFEAVDGTYDEQISLSEIPGASATNTITFTSQSADPAAVTLQHSAPAASDNHVVRLDGADHVRFTGLTLESTHWDYGRVVDLRGEVEGVRFEGNVFRGETGDGDSDAVIYADGATTTDLQFVDNRFEDGEYFIHLDGTTGTPSTGTVIARNTFTSSSVGQTGIVLRYHEGAEVVRNHLAGMVSGLRLEYASGTAEEPGRIVNNVLALDPSGYTGIELRYSSHYRIYHNTVRAGGHAFSHSGTGTGIELANNIFWAGDRALSVSASGGVSSDYNDLFTTGLILVRWAGEDYFDLEAYRQNTGQDANSESVDPAFTSETDLTPRSPFLDDEGTSLAEVTEDIDGDARDGSTPSLGASEYASEATPLAGGAYTIGPAGDYASFNAAVGALRVAGIAGPVVFEVLDGDYEEQLVLAPIAGASATNTVTFRAASGHPGGVTLHARASEADNYVVRLAGADHVVLEDLTLRADDHYYARVVDMRGMVEHVSLRDNVLVGTDLTNSNNVRAQVVVAGIGIVARDLVLEGNEVNNGTYGAWISAYRGSSYRDPYVPAEGTIIRGNTFAHASGGNQGVYLTQHEALAFVENEISGYEMGVRLSSCNGAVRLTGNRITAYDTGIDHSGDGTADGIGIVANNVITVDGGSDGLRMQNAAYQHVYFNTVNMIGGGRALWTSGDHVDLKNNLLASDGGTVLRANDTATLTSDYNDLYTTGSTLAWIGGGHADLAAYQAATGLDANSVSIDPAFTQDLVPGNAALDGAGVSIEGFDTDQYGFPRDADAPTIGALEFGSIPFDEVDVTFQVDLRHLERLGLFGRDGRAVPFVDVHIGPLPVVAPLSDLDRDTVWTAVVAQGGGSEIRYRLGLDIDGDTATVADRVYESAERMLTLPDGDHLVPAVAFDGQSLPSVPPAGFTAEVRRWLDPDGADEVSFDTPNDKTRLHLSLFDLDRHAVALARFYSEDATGTQPSGIAAMAKDARWTFAMAPADAATRATLALEYGFMSGIEVPGDLRLLHRPAPDAPWTVVSTQLDLAAGRLTASGVDLRGEWTIGSTTERNLQVRLPDLAVTDVQAPGTADRFGTITVTWTVTNEGGTTGATPWFDYLWLSRDETQNPPEGPNSGDFLLGKFPNVTALEPGESYTTTQTVELPQVKEEHDVSGNPVWARYLNEIRLFAQADNTTADVDDGTDPPTVHLDTGAVEESDEYNNERVTTVTINRPPPADLEVTGFTGPSTAFSGSAIGLNFTVTNRTDAAVTDFDKWTDAVYASEDDVFGNEDDRLLKRFTHEGELAPGESYTFFSYRDENNALKGTGVVNLPDDILDEVHLFVVVNEREVAYEQGSLGNNRAAWSVDLALTPPPDLAVTQLASGGDVRSGSEIQVVYMLQNLGPGDLGGDWTDVLYLSETPTLDESNARILYTDAKYVRPGPNHFLAPGPFYAKVTLPEGISGTYYLIMKADVNDDIFEYDREENNVFASAAFEVELAPPADLSVSGVTVATAGGEALSTVTGGDRLRVTYTVENHGPGPAVAPWDDRIFLSPSEDPEARGTKGLYGGKSETTLQPAGSGSGSAYTVSRYVDLPASLSGTYYLFVETNYKGGLYEHEDVHANLASSGAALTIESAPPPPPVDLAVADVAIAGDAAPQRSGTELRVSWSVENRGRALPVDYYWHDRVYLSPDTTFDTTDEFVERVRQSRTLDGDGTYTETFTFELSPREAGTYYVLVRTNTEGYAGAVRARDPTPEDNTGASAAAIEIRPRLMPDLSAFNVSVDETDIRAGQPLTVRWDGYNGGQGTTGSGWSDVVYLSEDATLDAEDTQVGFLQHDAALEANTGYDGHVEVEVPVSYVSGTYHVIVAADAGLGRASNGSYADAVDEEDEDNNLASLAIDVTRPPPSNLVVSGIQIPEEAQPGAPITVSYTLTNAGDHAVQGRVSDAIYFSADDAFQSDDALAGLHTHEIDLAPQASTTLSMQVDVARLAPADSLGAVAPVARIASAGSGAPEVGGTAFSGMLPGLAPGDYHGLVRVNARRTIREVDYGDNGQASAERLHTTVPAFGLDAPASFGVLPDGLRYFVFDTPGGTDLNLSLEAAAGTHALYVAHERLPTRADYDARSLLEAGAAPRIVLPSVEAGRYYVLVHGQDVPGGRTEAVLALEELDFAIASTHTDRIGDFGVVTLGVSGARFQEGARVALRRDGVEVLAREVKHYHTAYLGATFELGTVEGRSVETSDGTIVETDAETLPHGAWDLVVTNPDGRTAILPGALTVEARRAPRVEVSVEMPPTIVVRQETPATLVVHNPSNVDIENAVVRINMPAHTYLDVHLVLEDFGVTDWDYERDTWIGTDGRRYAEFMMHNLPPGATRTVAIAIEAPTRGDYELSANTLALTDLEFVYYLYELLARVYEGLGQPLALGDPTEGLPPSWTDEDAASATLLASTSFVATDAARAAARMAAVNCSDMPWEQRHARNLERLADMYEKGFGRGMDAVRKSRNRDAGHEKFGNDMINNTTQDIVEKFGGPGAGAAVAAGSVPLIAKDYWDAGNTIEDFYKSGLDDFIKESTRLRQQGFDSCEDPAGGPALPGGSGNGPGNVPGGGGIFGLGGWPIGGFRVLGSCDPNDILGPEGYGPENWIPADMRLNYTIRYENDPVLADAPARRVEIRQRIDDDLDVGSFRLGPFTFGSFAFQVPADRSFYHTRVDVRDSLGVYVDVIAGIDVTTREAFWILESIDPGTGRLSVSPLLGFLPVNDSLNRGQGTVQYTIRPHRDATTGDRIDAEASIVFDENAAIETPAIFHTVEAGLPTSTLAPLERSADADEIIVRWTGRDAEGGTGVASYALFAARGDEPFALYQDEIADTSLVFRAERGHGYRFYVRARDYAGNDEPDKGAAEGTIVLGGTQRVHPGDTNNDGAVDQADVLPLGQHFGRTGPRRSDAPYAWGGQPVLTWGEAAASYADADGDGLVDQADVLPIGIHYGRTWSAGKRGRGEAVATLRIPPLPVGKEFPAYIRVGSEEEPVSALLGIAAALEVADPALEVVSYEPAEMLDDGDLITFEHDDEEARRPAFAYTRKRMAAPVEAASGEPVIELVLKVVQPMGESVDVILRDAEATTEAGSAPVGSLSLTSPEAVDLPDGFTLEQNYPNPFNPRTTIRFAVPEAREVTLEVYDLLGRRVAMLLEDEPMKGGWHAVPFDGSRFASGVYFYRLTAGDFSEARKMVLVK